jgi:hypothetical protein
VGAVLNQPFAPSGTAGSVVKPVDGGIVSTVAKDHILFWLILFPAKSLTSVPTVAVYKVSVLRLAEGAKVAVLVEDE